ncbi:MAG: hypothetical protein BMS9Abin04_143 [Planctomycetia bacterium]|nr:MAG: hypothetical protein BMS9Abin04_143 [Planctomycetia bacterium]
MNKELIYKVLSESIIGAAMTVLNTLKPGLDEKLYERALVIELRQRGHRVEQQKEFPERDARLDLLPAVFGPPVHCGDRRAIR